MSTLRSTLVAAPAPDVVPEVYEGVSVPRLWEPAACPLVTYDEAAIGARCRARGCSINLKTGSGSLEMLLLDTKVGVAAALGVEAVKGGGPRLFTIDRRLWEYLKKYGYLQTVPEDPNPESLIVREFGGGFVTSDELRPLAPGQSRIILVLRGNDFELFCLRHGIVGLQRSAREQLVAMGVTDSKWLAAADPNIYPDVERRRPVTRSQLAAGAFWFVAGAFFFAFLMRTGRMRREAIGRRAVRQMVWSLIIWFMSPPIACAMFCYAALLVGGAGLSRVPGPAPEPGAEAKPADL